MSGSVYVNLKLRDQATKQLKASIGGMGRMVSKMAVGFGAFSLIKNGVKQISDAAEAQDSLNRLIGKDGTKALTDFANTASRTAGMTRAEVLETANNFAGLFGQIPAGAIDTGKTLAEIEQRVADLGSQFNKSTESINTGLQSALSGRVSLTLQQMGIDLSQTAMQARVAAGAFTQLGFDASTSFQSLSMGEQVLLRQKAFMDLTNKSAGNFAATLGISLPNQIKKMKAKFLEMSASLSKAVMPILNAMLPVLSKLAEFIERNAKFITILAGAFAAFKLGNFLVKMYKAIAAMIQLAVAKAAAAGGPAALITGGVVLAGLIAMLGGVAGGMLFGAGGSGSQQQAAATTTTVINVSGGATVDEVRSTNANHNVQTNFGRGS